MDGANEVLGGEEGSAEVDGAMEGTSDGCKLG